MWGATDERRKHALDSPYDFANYMTIGILDATWAGAKAKASKRYDSVYDFANWITLGTVDTFSGALNPDEVFSAEHLMDSLAAAAIVTGGIKMADKVAPGIVSVKDDITKVYDDLFKKRTNDPYAGVKQASDYLKSQGIPRVYRKQILESFNVKTITIDIADDATYGLRFYDNVNASAKGRYLFETFSNQINRNNLSLPYEWNKMISIQQWKVKPGTTIIKGTAAPQLQMGSQYLGGANQWYINNLDDLLLP